MTDDRLNPAHDARPARIPGGASIIVCGQVRGVAAAGVPASPPCYQAVDPWGEPDAGLPWFRIGEAASAAPLPDTRHLAMAEILAGTRWLLLVVGPGHDSLTLALTLASWARARGLRITAIKAQAAATPSFLRRTLQQGVHYFCASPSGLDPLAAARGLVLGANSGVLLHGDRVTLKEAMHGNGHLLWQPAAADGDPLPALRTLPPQLVALPPARARTTLLVAAGPLAPAWLERARAQAALPCPGGLTTTVALPATPGLPAGCYVFSA